MKIKIARVILALAAAASAHSLAENTAPLPGPNHVSQAEKPGIGAQVMTQDGKVIVLNVFEGSGAQQAGLQQRDLILSINGTDLSTLPSLGIRDVVGRLRGEAGSQVALTIQRGDAIQKLTITRNPLKQFPHVLYKMLTNEEKFAPFIGKPLDIKFTAVDGRAVDLSQLKGKVVLIDFWATWCGPCVEEIPNVKAAYDKYHDKGFEVVGISLDQDKAALEKMIASKQMPWPQYFDGKAWNNQYGERFGIGSIPSMWLIGKNGNLVDVEGRQSLAEKVEKLLSEATPN